VASLGVYKLAGNEEYQSLLQVPLLAALHNPERFMLIVALDWERPWDFLDRLRKWLDRIQSCLDTIQAPRDRLEEYRNRLLDTHSDSGVDGVASKCLGLPITVVCCKVFSYIYVDVKEWYMEHSSLTSLVCVHSVQHVLHKYLNLLYMLNNIYIFPLLCGSPCLTISRTPFLNWRKKRELEKSKLILSSNHYDACAYGVCRNIPFTSVTNLFLDGASLAYTTKFRPESFETLKKHIIQSCFQHQRNLHTTIEELKPNVVEKDLVYVPFGWDSVGKIKVLNEGFDCDAVMAEGGHLVYSQAIPMLYSGTVMHIF
jgi:hypothetical protein